MLDKQLFDSLNCFIFNEYFDDYFNLINSNLNNVYKVGYTQYHHVIPNSYCKELGLEQIYPICILSFKDHVLAHYYLSLCTSNDSLVYANICAVNYMTNNRLLKSSISKDWLSKNLPRLQEQYEFVRKHCLNCMDIPEIKDKHDSIMRSEEVRSKISGTLKHKCEIGIMFNEDHRKKLSQSMTGKVHLYLGEENLVCNEDEVDYYLSIGYLKGQNNPGTFGRTKMNNGHDIKFVEESEIDKYLQLGYKVGGLSYSLDSRQKMSQSHKGQSPSNKGTRLMNNGVNKLYVPKEKIDEYLSNGYVFGDIKKGGDVK